MATTVELIQSAYDHANRGRIDLAIADLQRHVRIHPDDADLQHHCGLLMLQNGQFDPALFHLEKALKLAPKRSDIQNNHATALNYMGRSEEAAESYRKALDLQENSFPAQLGLSSALIGTLDFDQAIDESKKAAELDPNRPEPHVNMALGLARSGRGREAVAALRAALEKFPGHPLLLTNLLMLLTTRPEAKPEEASETALQIGRAFTAMAGPPVPTFADMNPGRRLRVGYISQDFRDTALANFVRPVLTGHNRQEVEVYCYSTTHSPDKTSAALSRLADHWVEAARLGDLQLDQRIRADKIDILVELSGHTAGGRIAALARRCAPVQVSFPTYPTSTGLKAIGHRIVDALTDPPEADALASEKLTRIDGCCLCYAPPETPAAPEVSPGPGASGPVTFGCFAATTKINEAVLDAWAAILKAVPDSRLFLKTQAFGGESARGNYLALLAERGIESGRVQLAGFTPGAREHLAMYGKIDIALDTFPAGSPALACEALHMGVPVITMRGAAHAGRITASVLSAAGLEGMVADTTDAYIRLATDLARDKPRLASMRTALRGQLAASPLCDAAAYAGRLEAAYRAMWRAACENVYYT